MDFLEKIILDLDFEFTGHNTKANPACIDTQVMCSIESVKLAERECLGGEVYIHVLLRLEDTEYKGRYAKMKLNINDQDQERRIVVANLLTKLYFYCGVTPPVNFPTNKDLLEFNGCKVIVGLTIWSATIPFSGDVIEGFIATDVFKPKAFKSTEPTKELGDLLLHSTIKNQSARTLHVEEEKQEETYFFFSLKTTHKE